MALADLGYDGVDGHLMFPETTAVFDTGRRPMGFVHGGNSLQERVIPVLTVVHRAAAGGSTLQYGITAEAREGVAGMHCVEVRSTSSSSGRSTSGARRTSSCRCGCPTPRTCRSSCARRGQGAGSPAAWSSRPWAKRSSSSSASPAPPTRACASRSTIRAPSADVVPCVPDARFAVRRRGALVTTARTERGAGGERASWLEQFPEAGVRQVFEHLAAHGTVTENEAAAMLGGPRGLRRFAIRFEAMLQKAPFDVRIDVVAGVKRYVREGSG